jgi:hypothetical protein
MVRTGPQVDPSGLVSESARANLAMLTKEPEETEARTRCSRMGEGKVHTSGPYQWWPKHNNNPREQSHGQT